MEMAKGKCLNCGRTSDLVPLLRLEYREGEQWVCPQCLPILIHRPERLPSVAGEWTKGENQYSHDE